MNQRSIWNAIHWQKYFVIVYITKGLKSFHIIYSILITTVLLGRLKNVEAKLFRQLHSFHLFPYLPSVSLLFCVSFCFLVFSVCVCLIFAIFYTSGSTCILGTGSYTSDNIHSIFSLNYSFAVTLTRTKHLWGTGFFNKNGRILYSDWGRVGCNLWQLRNYEFLHQLSTC